MKVYRFQISKFRNISNWLQYFASIEKIRDRQEQDKVTKSTSKSLSAIEEFCEKFDRSVRQNIIKVTYLYNANDNKLISWNKMHAKGRESMINRIVVFSKTSKVGCRDLASLLVWNTIVFRVSFLYKAVRNHMFLLHYKTLHHISVDIRLKSWSFISLKLVLVT